MSEDDKQHTKPPPKEHEERVPAVRVFEFLATMVHELRNPMTPILGQVHLLRTIARDEPALPEKFPACAAVAGVLAVLGRRLGLAAILVAVQPLVYAVAIVTLMIMGVTGPSLRLAP